MKVKLDENLGRRGAQILLDGGCDVATVVGEDLCSAADATLIEVCRAEGRVLLSLDKDFANPLRFRPSRYAGVVVLRLPEPLSRDAIEDAIRRFLVLSTTRSPAGKLSPIDSMRIREFVLTDDSVDASDVVELREIHRELDRLVLDAYGWTAISVPSMTRSDAGFEDAVAGRLFGLNASRTAIAGSTATVNESVPRKRARGPGLRKTSAPRPERARRRQDMG